MTAMHEIKQLKTGLHCSAPADRICARRCLRGAVFAAAILLLSGGGLAAQAPAEPPPSKQNQAANATADGTRDPGGGPDAKQAASEAQEDETGNASDATANASDAAGEAAVDGETSEEKPPENPGVAVDAMDEDARRLLRRAEGHYFAGRTHIALKLFQRVIEAAPENALAYRYAGDIYLARGELDRAEEHFQIARELSLEPSEEWFRLGQLAYLREKPDAALEAFRRARALNPELHLTHFYEGLVQYRLRRDKRATITAWEAFRAAAPDDPQGPSIDRALAILRDPGYAIPEFDPESGAPLPEAGDARKPYMPGEAAPEKTDNQKEEIIDLDEL